MWIACLVVALQFNCNGDFTTAKISDRIIRPDKLTATIKGDSIVFGNLAASGSFGIALVGTSSLYKLHIYLGHGKIDTLPWSDVYYYDQNEPCAFLNTYISRKNMGHLTILQHDTQLSFVSGSFEFAVVDSTKDTIWVRDGMFQVHYSTQD